MLASTQISINLSIVPYIELSIYRGWQEVKFFFSSLNALQVFFFFFFYLFFIYCQHPDICIVPYTRLSIYRGWQEVTGKPP